MKFIKEMITRKHGVVDVNEGMDLSEFVENDNFDFAEDEKVDAKPEENLNASLTAIQEKLESALNRVEENEGDSQEKEDISGLVMNFSDVVEDRKRTKPVAKIQVQTTVKTRPKDEINSSKAEVASIENIDAAIPVKVQKAEADANARAREAVREIEAAQLKEETKPLVDEPVGNTAYAQPPEPVQAADIPVAPATSADQPQIDAKQPAESPAVAPEPVVQVIKPTPIVSADNEQVIKEDHAADTDAPVEQQEASSPRIVEVPAPAAGRAGRRAGRVKTRLLGFEHAHSSNTDPFDAKKDESGPAQVNFPVGWIVVINGPGRGSSFSLFNGVSQIGRGEDQAIKLDFGDNSISRDNHAAIAYDSEQRSFFLGHGGKANLVRLNNKPVLSTEEISDGDLIRIGETTLRFVALCNDEFDWENDSQDESDNAAIA